MVPPCFCDTIITPKADQVTTRSVTSAFFIDHKLGVCAVLFVGADEDICDTAIVPLGLLLYKQPAVAVSSTYWDL